jgi:2-dehydropantoate 2-reductase
VEKFGGTTAEKWAQSDRGDVYEELDAVLAAKAGGANWRPSMGQDVVKGRITEINQMNGFVLKKAREVDVEAPVTASIVEAVRAIDAGKLRPGKENVERVLSAAGY